MGRLAVVLLAVLLIVARAAPVQADCRLHVGDHIVLYSTSDDPDVLLWDSRIRLRDYHAATFDEAKQLAPRARLVEPGTRAVVIECVPDFVQSRLLEHPDDAIGVIIVSGTYRGKSGWVLSSDVRGAPHSLQKP